MQGLNYMLLGIAIMVLGHGIIVYIAPVSIIFDMIGFCIVIYGFQQSKENHISLDKKVIGSIKIINHQRLFITKTIKYNDQLNTYNYENSNQTEFQISEKCLIKVLSENSPKYNKVNYS